MTAPATPRRRLPASITAERLRGMGRGVEKESLRTTPEGMLSITPHPPVLGAALTHPSITTDFCESQLELITGVHPDADACATELHEIHRVVAQALRDAGDQRMWANSMPCGLPTDETIPIGRYGTSNVGRAKSVYRMGLGHRYGRRMQTISGIHYNWSLPGLGNDEYFALIRNFRRQSFLLLVLYGASPAVCGTFVEGRDHPLQPLGACGSYYQPYATSLRMGSLGYQSDAQAQIRASFNDLEGYAASLHGALTTPYPAYEKIGVINPGGEYNQLSTTLLQIENEFYGTIRPKRSIRSGERPLHALRERGVEYIEVRCMDLDPFETTGIAAATMRFIDVFLLDCLTRPSPADSPEEVAALQRNQRRAAHEGRRPGLMLERGTEEIPLVAWGAEILERLSAIAADVDAALGGDAYRQAVAAAQATWSDLDSAPSARVLREMATQHGDSFLAFNRTRSDAAQRALLDAPPDAATVHRYRLAALTSIAEQRQREQADTVPFEVYRQWYLAPEQLGAGTAAPAHG